MSEDLEYRVLPREPKFKTVSVTEEEKNAVEGLGIAGGCVIWGLLCGVLWIVIVLAVSALGAWSGVPYKESYTPIIVFCALAISIVVTGVYVARMSSQFKSRNIEYLEKTRVNESQTAYQWDIHHAANEATSLTSNLISLYKSSTQLASELPQHLKKASSWLRKAEIEYGDNAYSPFWDAVENAARQLAAFNDKAKRLSQNAAEYYRKLEDRNHTFPVFPIKAGTIPNAASTVRELRRIVRMGQTNFQFANIWEHRRTREVLIAGFRTLGEAINNLGATVENSVSDLQQSVSSDTAKLVEEGIKTREELGQHLLEQSRMLDNIQHSRKPKVTDRPSKQ